MTQYAATFAAVAVTAAQDVFEITAPAGKAIRILEVRIAQYSDAGDAEAESLSVQFLRGHPTGGSGGSTLTPVKFNPQIGSTAGSTVKANNTTVASGSGAETLLADSMTVSGGFYWRAVSDPPLGILVQAGERFVARITAPADSLTMNGTLVFEEIG